MRSVGLDLRRWIDAGQLRVWAARPSAYGLEAHLTIFAQLVDEVQPSVAVLDGLAGLLHGASDSEVTAMVAREIYLLKSRQITTLATTLASADESSTVSISSLVDTWLLLRNVESNGERNRLLYVLKSRGSAHSNQVREFVLTDHGVELVDVYVGPAGILAGSARLVQEAQQRAVAQQQADEFSRHRRQLQRRVGEQEAQLRLLEEELAASRAELDRLDVRERSQSTHAQADRTAMATWRWADPPPTGK
ncbi:ATPase domain-containing protein [Mycolicibacterium chubuense]|uniref:ATPase domain-containing protein n=1 Tax=Mycolicibacterium chubuense TaxID=1800 RepID=UPI0023B0A102|nr:ATPase domain-containing protein [Mycolicibacterium chubuense]